MHVYSFMLYPRQATAFDRGAAAKAKAESGRRGGCKARFLRKAVIGYCQGRNRSERPLRPHIGRLTDLAPRPENGRLNLFQPSGAGTSGWSAPDLTVSPPGFWGLATEALVTVCGVECFAVLRFALPPVTPAPCDTCPPCPQLI